MAASLGEAFIDVKASTKGFAKSLSAQLKAVLADAQAQANVAFASIAESSKTASKAVTTNAATAAKAQATSAQTAARAAIQAEKDRVKRISEFGKQAVAAAKAADAERIASNKAAEKEIAAASAARLRSFANAAKAAVAAQKAADKQRVADAKAAEKAIADASTARLKAFAAAAKQAVAAQKAADKERVAAAKAAEKEIAAAANARLRAFAAAAKAAVAAQKAADKERTAAAKAAEKAIRAEQERTAAQIVRIKRAETAAYREAAARQTAAAAAAARQQAKDAAIAEAANKAASRSVAAAWIAAYRQVSAAARAAAAEQTTAAAKAAAAIKSIASPATLNSFNQAIDRTFVKGAQRAGQAIQRSLVSALRSVRDAVVAIPTAVFDGIVTGAKFATAGAVALGVALTAIGLQGAGNIQLAESAFASLAQEITGATEKIDDFQARQRVGEAFVASLQNISLESSIAFTSLVNTTQALIGVGFAGDEAKAIVTSVGDALAASGKAGGQLNDDLQGIVRALTQTAGAGRLLAQDLLQITTRLPAAQRTKVYAELAESLGIVGKNAKLSRPELDKMNKTVQKLAEEGKISSEVGLGAILKVIQDVPGAEGALERVNKTLPGQIEELKERVRLGLAQAFLPVTQQVADLLAPIGLQVTNLFKQIAPTLQAFAVVATTSFGTLVTPIARLIESALGAVTTVLPAIVGALGPFLGILGNVLTIGAPALQAIAAGFQVLFEAIGPVITEFAKFATAQIIESLPTFIAFMQLLTNTFFLFAQAALPAFLAIFPALNEALIALQPSFELLTKSLADNAGLLPGLIVAFAELAIAIIPLIPPLVTLLATFLEISLTLGAPFIQVLQEVIGVIASLIVSLKIPEILGFIAAIVAVVAKFVLLKGIVLAVRAAVVAAFGALVAAVGLPLAIIAAVVAAFALLYFKIEAVRDFINNLLGPTVRAIGEFFVDLGNKIQGVVDKIGEMIGKIPGIGLVGKAFSFLKGSSDEATSAVTKTSIALASIPSLTTAKVVIQTQVIGATPGVTDPSDAGRSARAFSETPEGQAKFAAFQEAQKQAAALAKLLADSDKAAASLGSDLANEAADKAADRAEKAASAAKNRLRAFKEAIKAILESIDAEFRTTLTTGTAKQIDTALDGLRKKVTNAFEAARKAPPSRLLKRIKSDNEELKSLATEREKILDRLADATARAQEVASATQQFANGAIADTVSKIKNQVADLSRLRIILPGQDAVSGPGGTKKQRDAKTFADELKARLKAIRDFQADIRKLIKSGLNKETIDEIISAGVEGGSALADSLAGASKATIKSINDSQAAIKDAGEKLGDTAADSLFRAGKNVADGLIEGLKDKRDEIKDAMKTIADDLVAEIKKQLKIKSPSEVTRALGNFTGEGFALGLLDEAGAVARAGSALAAVSIPQLQRMSSAEGLASLSGIVGGSVGAQVTNQRTIQAPITNNINMAPGQDPLALADALGRQIAGRLR